MACLRVEVGRLRALVKGIASIDSTVVPEPASLLLLAIRARTAVVPERLGLSIAWHNVPFQQGGWAEWDAQSVEDRNAYARLLAPDRGRFFMVGDQVSTLPGWQEGAMMSAEHVVEQIGGFRPLAVPDIERAPDTRRLVQGRF